MEDTDAGVVLSANDSLVAGTPFFGISAMAPTAFRFTLTVTSQGGRTSLPVHTQLEVVAPPSVKVVPSSLVMDAGTSAMVSAALSSDPAGSPLSFAWSVVSGGVTLGSPASAIVNVTALPDAGASAQVQVIVSNPAVSADPVVVPIRIL